MIAPSPAFANRGATALASRTRAVVLSATSRSLASAVCSMKVPDWAAPALLMRSVTRPCREFTPAAKDFTLSSLATSTTCVVTSALLFARDCAVCCNPASSRSARASAEPAAASRCASARPMPELAPVTTATPLLTKDMKGFLMGRVHITPQKKLCHAFWQRARWNRTEQQQYFNPSCHERATRLPP